MGLCLHKQRGAHERLCVPPTPQHAFTSSAASLAVNVRAYKRAPNK